MNQPQPIRALPFPGHCDVLGLLFFPLDLNPKGGKAITVLNILLPKGKAILKMGPNYRVKRRWERKIS